MLCRSRVAERSGVKVHGESECSSLRFFRDVLQGGYDGGCKEVSVVRGVCVEML